MTAHKAMDVPKHYTAEQLVGVMEEVVRESGIEKPSSKAASKGVNANLERHNTFEEVQAWLDLKHNGGCRAIWIPCEHVVLGEEAAVRMAAILRSRSESLGIKYFDRSVQRRPMVELASLITHKLSRSVGAPVAYPSKGALAITSALAHSKKTPINKPGVVPQHILALGAWQKKV